jgi:DNA-binding MarR family transcriptional regulator
MTAVRWLDDREQEAWRAFLRMHAQLAARLNRELPAGLTLAEFEVLVALSDVPAERLRAYELGAALQWEKSRVSHQVRRMEHRGLVAREECPEDGRGAFVVLTAAGRRALEDAAPAHVATVRRLFLDVLSAEQVDALGEVSAAVLRRLDEDPG